MKTYQKLGLPLAALASTVTPAMAQEALSLDDRVNAAFATFTGPFVSLIFAPFPGTNFPWIVMWPVKVAKAALTRSSRLSASCAIAGVTVEASAARGRPSF